MLKRLLPYVVAVGCLCAAGCSINAGASMDDDHYLQRLLSTTPQKQEALAWLTQKDGKERTVGESSEDMDATDSLRFVQDLYRRGAAAVVAVDIETDAHMETTSTLIVTLPQETSARKKLFQIEAKVARQAGSDAVTDQGQHYIMLHW